MIKNIYIDNFKGFQNTYLLLKDVNFFVGENSTGKTSIMNLINCVTDINFLLYTDLRRNKFDLGSFSDIVSQKSDNKDYFKVGFFKDDGEVKENELNTKYAILVKFINDDETPRVSEIFYITKSHHIKLIIKNNKDVYYNATPNEFIQNNKISPISIIKNWTNKDIILDDSFRLVKESLPSTNLSLYFLMQIISLEISKNNNNNDAGVDFGDYMPNWLSFAPIRAQPKKTYDNYLNEFSPEGDHIPYLLSNIFRDKKSSHSKEIIKRIEKFGTESGLYDAISIKKYGDSKESPFALNIELGNKILKISNVGYGVSQVLPIIIEIMNSSEQTKFAIQQPEIHLHPRAQASLGEFVYEAAFNEHKKFIIETHSDYIIDRFRYNLKIQKNQKKNLKSQVVFFERKKGNNVIHQIDIESDGEYSEQQPKSYRDFFIKEELKNLSFE